MSHVDRHRLIVQPEESGARLDQLLAARVPGLSRRQARVVIDIGGVFVDRGRVKVAGRPMRPGQVVEVHLGGALARATRAVGKDARARDDADQPIAPILHLDPDLVVVDKPAALITAPTPESDRHNLAHQLEAALGPPIFVVHRLDLGTSGVLVLARSDHANRALSERFRQHDIERRYLAVLLGDLPGEAHRVDQSIDGRAACTQIRALERLGGRATLVECTLETGRTHQIRRHARHLGHPVLGDRRYGQPNPDDLPAPPRLALHAARLGFIHPTSGAAMLFESPLPADLSGWLEDLRAATARQDT